MTLVPQGNDRGAAMIASDFELQNTLDKLAELEEHIAPKVEQARLGTLNPVARLSLRSLRRLANSLREEIARYRAQQSKRKSEQTVPSV